MRLIVRLYGDLRRYLPKGQDPLTVELPDGTTVLELLGQIGIHPGEVWVVRANQRIIPEEQQLHEGDDVEIFEPVGGGGPYIPRAGKKSSPCSAFSADSGLQDIYIQQIQCIMMVAR